MSGECEICGEHAMECQCVKKECIGRNIVSRIEDLGRAREILQKIWDDKIFDGLSKHETFWHSEYEVEREKLNKIRQAIFNINEHMEDLWVVLIGEES